MNSQYLKKKKNPLVQFNLKFHKEKMIQNTIFAFVSISKRWTTSIFRWEVNSIFSMLRMTISSSHRNSDQFRNQKSYYLSFQMNHLIIFRIGSKCHFFDEEKFDFFNCRKWSWFAGPKILFYRNRDIFVKN